MTFSHKFKELGNHVTAPDFPQIKSLAEHINLGQMSYYRIIILMMVMIVIIIVLNFFFFPKTIQTLYKLMRLGRLECLWSYLCANKTDKAKHVPYRKGLIVSYTIIFISLCYQCLVVFDTILYDSFILHFYSTQRSLIHD